MEYEDESFCDWCNKNPADELHPCPYAEELFENFETCNCCKECESECLSGI